MKYSAMSARIEAALNRSGFVIGAHPRWLGLARMKSAKVL